MNAVDRKHIALSYAKLGTRGTNSCYCHTKEDMILSSNTHLNALQIQALNDILATSLIG